MPLHGATQLKNFFKARVINSILRYLLHRWQENLVWLIVQDSLRCQFSEALKWYNTLQDTTTKHVDNVLYHVWTIITGYNNGAHTTTLVSTDGESTPRATQSTTLVSPNNKSTPLTTQPPHIDAVEGDLAPEPLFSSTWPPPVTMIEIEDEGALLNARLPRPLTPLNSLTASPSMPISRKQHRSEDTDGLSTPFPMPIPRDRPSDYLHSRCPLCFGRDPNQRLGGNV